MADEKLNTGQEENSQPSLFDAGPEGAPTPEPRHKRTPPSRPPGIRPPRMPPLGPLAR